MIVAYAFPSLIVGAYEFGFLQQIIVAIVVIKGIAIKGKLCLSLCDTENKRIASSSDWSASESGNM